MIASMLDVGGGDGGWVMPRSTGQGARARHWPVHGPKTQSPAAATLLKLTRLSENGLAAIGAVTPLAHAFLPRTLPGARQGKGVAAGWRAGASKQFPSFAASCPDFSVAIGPIPDPRPPSRLRLSTVDSRPSAVPPKPQSTCNQHHPSTTRPDQNHATTQRIPTPSCVFPFAPSFRRAQRRPVISARLLRGFS